MLGHYSENQNKIATGGNHSLLRGGGDQTVKHKKCGGKYEIVMRTVSKNVYKCNKCARRFVAYRKAKEKTDEGIS